jgi:hypothetical protein
MLFRTVVLLTSKVNLLMNGVAPAVSPVIVIVVSSACVAQAGWDKIIKTAPTAINGNVFISRIFLEVSPDWVASVSRNAVRVQQKINDTQFIFWGIVELIYSEIAP